MSLALGRDFAVEGSQKSVARYDARASKSGNLC
jgi:hypothetical protein